MLLIWGWKVRLSRSAGGRFFCPNEGGDRDYQHVAARRWFTFFWIPMIPLKRLGEYVECTSCGATYDQGVLSHPTTAQLGEHLTSALRHAVVAVLRAEAGVIDDERSAAVAIVGRAAPHPYGVEDLERDLATLDVSRLEAELAAAASTLSTVGQEEVVRSCLGLAAADGNAGEAELAVLHRIGRALGMSYAHVSGVLAETASTAPHDQYSPPNPDS